MRLSAENGDMGWDVWVDGVLQNDVVMADDVRGEVEIYVRKDTSFSFAHGHIERETIYGKVEIKRAAGYPDTGWLVPKVSEPSKVDGLVAPQWSDAGPVPVGEVTTYTLSPQQPGQSLTAWLVSEVGPILYDIGMGEYVDWAKPARKADPNAKPAMSALGRVAGEEYRGLGWCDE